MYDFSVHKKRAKKLGLLVFTDEYKDELKNRKLLAKNSQESQGPDNLFCCQEPECKRKFRKENQLRVHIKNYHKESANQIGVCSDISNLAYQHKDGLLLRRDTGSVSFNMSTLNTLRNSTFAQSEKHKGKITKRKKKGVKETKRAKKSRNYDEIHIDESVIKNEITDAGPIPVAIYRTPNFEHTEQADTFFISYVDSKY